MNAPEPDAFQIEVRPDRDRVLVCPSGDVDLATAHVLEGETRNLLDSGFDRVVIDLRAVTFIDSTGIRALLAAHRHARASRRSVSIILGSPATRRPLELSGIIDHLEIDPASNNGHVS